MVIIHISAHGLHANGKKTGFGVRLDKDYSYTDISNFLNIVDGHYRHLVLIVDACHSGGFIETCKKENRWILTATAKDEFEYGNRLFLSKSPTSNFSKMLFTANFISALKSSKTWNEAFEKSRATWKQVLRVAKLKRPKPQSFLPEGEDLPLPSQKVSASNNLPGLTNSIGMKLVFIPEGTFKMGSPSSESERYSDERQHKVTLTKDFYMGTTEVTQAQWRSIMGNNPSRFIGDNHPVENVSWNDAKEFIRKLNQKEGTEKYRLPTEAEWEYACRAGTTTPFYTGNCISTDQANYSGNYPMPGCSKGRYRKETVRGGSFSPNAWGLYDMHGNVYEWCEDWYDKSHSNRHVTDPKGPSSGTDRVLRGGSWHNFAWYIRSAFRLRLAPDHRDTSIGFRVVRAY